MKNRITIKKMGITISILMIFGINFTYSQSKDSLFYANIEQYSSDIAKNTVPPTIAQRHTDYIAIGIAFLAFITTLVSVTFMIQTYRNTKSLRSITQKEKILKELIRHLYRNKVVVTAIIRELRDNVDKFPSEEHLLKIQFSEDALYMSKFSDFFKNFAELHHLEIRFRNFNIEAGVALEHLKNRSLSIEIKEKDLKSLSSKIDGLANEIFKLLIKDKDSQAKTDMEKLKIKQYLIEQSENRDGFHNPPLFFEDMFKDDDNSVLEKDISKRTITWL